MSSHILSNSVFLKNLSPLLTTEIVREFLLPHLPDPNEILRVEFRMFSGTAQRYCQVDFRTSAGVTAATSLNGQCLLGVPLVITVIDPTVQAALRPPLLAPGNLISSCAAQGLDPSLSRGLCVPDYNYPPRETEAQQLARTIHVANVPESWTLRQVIEHLAALVKQEKTLPLIIVDSRLIEGVASDLGKRIALIELKTAEMAEAVKSLPPALRTVNNSELIISQAKATVRPREPDNVSFNLPPSVPIPVAYQQLNKLKLQEKISRAKALAERLASKSANNDVKQPTNNPEKEQITESSKKSSVTEKEPTSESQRSQSLSQGTVSRRRSSSRERRSFRHHRNSANGNGKSSSRKRSLSKHGQLRSRRSSVADVKRSRTTHQDRSVSRRHLNYNYRGRSPRRSRQRSMSESRRLRRSSVEEPLGRISQRHRRLSPSRRERRRRSSVSHPRRHLSLSRREREHRSSTAHSRRYLSPRKKYQDHRSSVSHARPGSTVSHPTRRSRHPSVTSLSSDLHKYSYRKRFVTATSHSSDRRRLRYSSLSAPHTPSCHRLQRERLRQASHSCHSGHYRKRSPWITKPPVQQDRNSYDKRSLSYHHGNPRNISSKTSHRQKLSCDRGSSVYDREHKRSRYPKHSNDSRNDANGVDEHSLKHISPSRKTPSERRPRDDVECSKRRRSTRYIKESRYKSPCLRSSKLPAEGKSQRDKSLNRYRPLNRTCYMDSSEECYAKSRQDAETVEPSEQEKTFGSFGAEKKQKQCGQEQSLSSPSSSSSSSHGVQHPKTALSQNASGCESVSELRIKCLTGLNHSLSLTSSDNIDQRMRELKEELRKKFKKPPTKPS